MPTNVLVQSGSYMVSKTRGSTCLRVVNTTSPVRSVIFSPDNTYVASGTEKGVQLWETSNGINFVTFQCVAL
ncbi:hypothetical protein PILCRDRAFT_720897 [Piloderma croceum F 1598]|uniref:Anaphase-promoting complex subunit 4 WD40 domain-containing protein n=1 Tax=Piloderma croceum (strain F 1598) TaxID=765440 RepID=A0A0C3B8Y9_PILCF|nr:hypothetical protein PILCRDRAFT_720897 [Piloderma croceum F 1598]